MYGVIIDRWATLPVVTRPLSWNEAACQARWSRGLPLLAETAPDLSSGAVEEVLGPVMEAVSGLGASLGPPLQGFAEAWDRAAIRPTHLLPARGRIGSVPEDVWFEPKLLAFLAAASLRPFLDVFFSEARHHAPSSPWTLGVCLFCGAPAAFADVLEDGQRRLACHVCGGTWAFARLRCPFCGIEESKDLVRLQPEQADEGYTVEACTKCGGYLKGLDRRVRWNGRSGLIEDWGSPHLDLVARRAGYWRPIPSLLDLVDPA